MKVCLGMEVEFHIFLNLETHRVKMATHYHVVPRLNMKTDPVTH